MSDLARWMAEVVYFFGYPGVAVLMALSNLLLLIPSELILPVAGYHVSQGRFSFPLVLGAATMGSLVSALTLYALGRWLGEKRLRRFIGRFGRFGRVGKYELDRASKGFDCHGGKAVLLGRLFPGIGNLISVPAGIERMPVWRFIIYSTLGNGFWNGALIGLGWMLGDQWTMVEQYAPIIKYAALVAIAGGIFWFLRSRWKAHRR